MITSGTISGDITLRGDRDDLETLAHRFAFEMPDKVDMRNRLQGMKIPRGLIDNLLRCDSGMGYQDMYHVLCMAKQKGKPLPRQRINNLLKRIWAVRGMDDLVEVGRFDSDGDLHLPRGLLGDILGLLPYYKDEKSCHHGLHHIQKNFTPRGYQAEAVGKALEHYQGLIIAPCGAGKTVMGCELIHRTRAHTLILAHNLDLVEQWRQNIKQFLGMDAGIYGDNQESWQEITIATLQTLHRRQDTHTDTRLSEYGMCIIDEAHIIPAQTFGAVINRVPAHYRYGLTATPERPDGWTPMLYAHVGHHRAEVRHEDLYYAGAAMRPEIIIHRLTGWPVTKKDPTDEWSAFLTDLCMDDKRQATLAGIVEKTIGTFALALCGRVAQAEDMADRLQRRGIAAEALHGKKKGRKKILEAARAGEYKILCATTVADEGLDLPAIDRVYLCAPSKAVGRTIQRIGRGMRPCEDKTTTEVHDFVDYDIPVCRAQYYKRRQAYRQIGATMATAKRR